MTGLIVDNFAGGGGASLAIEQAMGRPIDIAINHSSIAMAMHAANHPHAKHFREDVWTVDPRKVCAGRPVELAWFSPDCKHHSKAKGGKPLDGKNRALAWIVLKWAGLVRPAQIYLENVEEFADWGPLTRTHQPCKKRKGMTFQKWVSQLEALGYHVEWREIRACDYGAPTIRKRLFLIARCDGQPICWPEPTHGPGLIPFRSAADCIDWSIPCPSIFERKRPLAQNTLKRIARGIQRYVIDAKEPFIVGVGGRAGQSPERGVSEPLGTATTKADKALVTPYFIQRYGEREGQKPRVRPVDEPIQTIVPSANGAQLIAPVLITNSHGESGGRREYPVDDPVRTITASNNKALVMAFMAQHNTGVVGHDMREPVSTIVGRGTTQGLVTSHLLKLRGTCKDGQPVTEPMPTVTAGGTHIGEVRAFLLKYYGTDTGQSLKEPLHTVTTKDRYGLVTIAGIDYQIVDIGMRMLNARELFRAQGFPEEYVINPIFNGKYLTKTEQNRMCGNSVCPPPARALIEANNAAEILARGVA